MQALRYETPHFTEYEEEEGEGEGEVERGGGGEDGKKDLSLEATYSEGEWEMGGERAGKEVAIIII